MRLLRRLFQRPAAAFGTVVVLLFGVLALIGPQLTPYSATQQIAGRSRQPPSLAHLFGTDRLGRDVFSRVVAGSREVILLAGVATLVAVVLGAVVGLVTTYLGGWLEEVTFRLFDSLLAIPALLLALLLLGVLGVPESPLMAFFNILIVIVIAYTPIVARVVRSVVLDTKTKDYVAAARMQGEGLGFILTREILPSVLPVLAVEGALRFSYAIFLIASLGFLGVGVRPPNPNWGLMVNEEKNFVTLTPWTLYFPAAAIALLVISVNLMADGLKRVLQVET
jgi:peptide/nickel transport system permease protein